MLNEGKRSFLLRKMRAIFQANNLSRAEIIALLQTGEADYSDVRVEQAACRIADLVREERLSIEDTVTLFKISCEAERNNSF